MFLKSIIDFTIISFAIFLAVKGINSLQKKQEAAPTPPSDEVIILREIRDLLKSKN
jgi:large conductance mechanosensitive channel